MTDSFNGFYKGICTNNADPEGLSRIKAVVPQAFGDGTTECDWALPMFPSGWGTAVSIVPTVAIYAGGLPANAPGSPGYVAPAQAGTPVPGSGVWIAFEGGDLNYPLWCGVWQSDS